MLLDEASVTATENAVMAAALSRGATTIRNAASEPHVQNLCHMLVGMGAADQRYRLQYHSRRRRGAIAGR